MNILLFVEDDENAVARDDIIDAYEERVR